MKVLCNNPHCRNAVSRKIFEAPDLSAECPSCGENNLLPESAARFMAPNKHKSSQKVAAAKREIKKKYGADSLAQKDKSELKKIEFSYSKKMAELESAMKNSKFMKRFKAIDSHLNEGDLELKDIRYELEKLDKLFKSYHSSDGAGADKSKTKNKTRKSSMHKKSEKK